MAEASAFLTRVMLAQLTVMEVTPVPPVGLESPEPSLVVVKWARLSIAPVAQVAELVWLVMCTTKVAPPPARSVGPQVRLPPAMVQAGVVGVWESTLQDRPVLVGSTSVMVKPWATPAPLLVAVIV